MNTSIKWLNQYLDHPIEAEEAEVVLTDCGFPLDGIEAMDDDAMLDVEITSNRADCFSHIGIAREITAATDRKLVEPLIKLPKSDGTPVEQLTRVDNDAVDLCPLYTARVIRGVKVGPSPDWLRQAVESIGQTSVNNVVDVTNFVLFEMGQPLHTFDLNRLEEKRIVVRRAEKGEAFVAIDGSKHQLNETMLVIADANRPVAIAGVMGGLDSEISEQTTDVLLESARFAQLSVRATSRALKLASDSSFRFERGVDPAGVERASQRAAQLIIETAGGELAEGVIAVGEPVAEPHEVTMRPSRCNQLMGYELSADRMVELLEPLGVKPTVDGDLIRCMIPTFRLDLHREVDLIEEVARLQGFDYIEVEPDMHLTVRKPQAMVLARQKVGDVLVAHGYFETVNFSNMKQDHATPFKGTDVELVMLNEEQKKAEPALRPSLLPSLLECRKLNQDAGNVDVKLFEVATIFGKRDDQYETKKQLCLLADAEEDAGAALRQVRGTIEELLATLGCEYRIVASSKASNWAEPSALIVDANDESIVIGKYGLSTPQTNKLFDLQKSVVLAELDYALMTAHYPRQPKVQSLARFPGIERDLSVLVDESIQWNQIAQSIKEVEPDLLTSCDFIGVYRGKQIGKGRKSVTLRMTFKHPEKTLRHEEVDGQVEAVVAQLKQAVNAELRV